MKKSLLMEYFSVENSIGDQNNCGENVCQGQHKIVFFPRTYALWRRYRSANPALCQTVNDYATVMKKRLVETAVLFDWVLQLLCEIVGSYTFTLHRLKLVLVLVLMGWFQFQCQGCLICVNGDYQLVKSERLSDRGKSYRASHFKQLPLHSRLQLVLGWVVGYDQLNVDP